MDNDPYSIRPQDLSINAPRPRTLYNSKFLKIYDAVPRKPHALDVIKHLGEVAHPDQVEAYRTLFRASKAKDPTDKKRAAIAAVKHWSSGGEVPLPPEDLDQFPPLFKALNRALIMDDAAKLQHFAWFVRALNSHLTNEENAPKRNVVTWRGSKMDAEQAAMLAVGAVVRPSMYVASSVDRDVGEFFAGEGRFLLKFNVPAGCRNATAIHNLAVMKHEKEVLMPPYTPLLVKRTGQEMDLKIIEMDVLDGMVFGAVERGMQGAHELIDGLPDSFCGSHARACIV